MANTEQDNQLVEKVKQGDEEAFQLMVKKYEKLIYYIVLQNVRNTADASDIVQETFIQVKRSIHSLNEIKFFKAWLNRIAFSKIAKFYQKRKDIPLNEESFVELKNVSENRLYMLPEKQSHFQTDKEILHDCLQRLKPIYRNVLVLRYFEEMSMSEMAVAMGIPEGTVKSRLNIAKTKLKEEIVTLEKTQGIVLDFKSVSLESLLVATFLYQWDQLVLPKAITTIASKSFFSKLMTHPIATTVFCGSIVMTAVGIGALSQTLNRSSIDPMIKDPVKEQLIYQEAKVDVFPKTLYKGEEIITARDAYIALYRSYLSNDNHQEVENLHKVLQEFGGSYADMSNKLFQP